MYTLRYTIIAYIYRIISKEAKSFFFKTGTQKFVTLPELRPKKFEPPQMGGKNIFALPPSLPTPPPPKKKYK